MHELAETSTSTRDALAPGVDTEAQACASRRRGGTGRRVWRWVGRLALLALAAVVSGLSLGLWTLRASLPIVDGRVSTAVSAEASIARDGAGVVTISGATRDDVAFASGFAHAQDRFFQMDLARRRAAGELAALVGRVALELDRRTRLHRFRALSRDIVTSSLRAEHRALLEAYTAGVNAGLASLQRKPFEYYLLQSEAAPWQPEDSVLVLYSMFLALQNDRGAFESDRGLMHDVLPESVYSFLTSAGGDWDTPLDASRLSTPELPPQNTVNPGVPRAASLARPGQMPTAHTAAQPESPANAPSWVSLFAAPTLGITTELGLEDRLWTPHAGSNNWAVAGSRTASGRALVANDMHLNLSVPHIWYRASLSWGRDAARRTVTGVMLPGAPAIVVGSNTDVAWGFTNSEGDSSDLILLELPPDRSDAYVSADGVRPFTHFTERIAIKGEDDDILDVVWTTWGPVIDEDHRGRRRALRWTAHDPEAVNFDLLDLERASSVADALPIAHRAGVPALNMVVGDRQGSIAWTMAGRIPKRVGCDGQVPRSWASGTCGWQGYLEDAAVPAIVNPPAGFVATANNRIAGGTALEAIGIGRYDEGARARSIVDGLQRVSRATPADMLAVQLDDRALFLDRWRSLAMRTLDRQGTVLSADRQAFRALIETTWTGRASIDSVGYRLVRTFRGAVAEVVLRSLTRDCVAADSRFDPLYSTNYEGPLWKLVTEQPDYLLDSQFTSWHELLLDAVDRAVAAVRVEGEPLERRTWGERNTLRMRHPLSAAIPGISRWLDMPSQPLPGDAHMPRVQGVSHAASERMAVSPGLEHEGYLHMPGGQSGHPWSPHFRDGHDAWATGTSVPLLPGRTEHTLVLEPAPSHP